MKTITACVVAVPLTISSIGAQTKENTDLQVAWRAQVEQLGPIADKLSPLLIESDNPRNRLELFDFMYSNISMAYFGMVYSDPAYPDFWPGIQQAYRVGYPNPDDSYYFVPLDDDGTYKISGYRGTVRVLDFQINGGTAGKTGVGLWGPALINYSADDLKIEDNGWFEVILSAKRPEGYTGNWWHLDKGASWIMARQRSYDWLKEVDGRIGIERLDRPAIQPRETDAQLAEKLSGLAKWAETWTRIDLTYAKEFYKRNKINEFQLIDLGNEGGWTGKVQTYPQTIFKLKKDEALIVETEVPAKCRYWNFQLVDTLWRTLGGQNQFNSINGHQAVLDADGKFRFVVSATDPGVPNWLDDMGYETGFVSGRWNVCSESPLPTAKVVKVAEVRKYLPTDTPTVSPEERDRLLRLRRLGAQMRKRW